MYMIGIPVSKKLCMTQILLCTLHIALNNSIYIRCTPYVYLNTDIFKDICSIKFEYFGEFKFIFETNLGYESGDQVGTFDFKNQSKVFFNLLIR